MYNSIISNAVQKSVFRQAAAAAMSKSSVKSASGLGRMSGTTVSTAPYDMGKVTVGLSTSSSMRSENMPHLIP